MYGKLFSIFGIAFILFLAIMIFTAMLRTGFSGILKSFLSRLFILLFIVAFCLTIGIGIYAVITGTSPLDTLLTLADLIRSEVAAIW